MQIHKQLTIFKTLNPTTSDQIILIPYDNNTHQYDKTTELNQQPIIADKDSTTYKLNCCRPLLKQSLIIKAFEPDLKQTTHSVLLHIFSDGVQKHHLPNF